MTTYRKMRMDDITVHTDFGVSPFEVDDEIRIVMDGHFDELYRIKYINGDWSTVKLSLVRMPFILKQQFNNVLFKMWER